MPESRVRRMSFWSWGFEDAVEIPDAAEDASRAKEIAARFGVPEVEILPRPRLDEFALPAPRVTPPGSLGHLLTTDPAERLAHSFGKSFADGAHAILRELPHTTDIVAFPESAEDVGDILDWAAREDLAVVPVGGGSTVVGGIEPAVGEGYGGVLSLNMRAMNRIVEIDRTSRAARVEAGILGPDLEAGLRPHGLTLRHFPQSFEYSTLGGWIATRSGGHFASLYTHIDDFVESLSVVAPSGRLESRRLPGSGAGPSPDRMIIGSEGTLGVITDAWVRLQDRPRHRASVAVLFEDYYAGAEAVRALSQSGLFPTNCRLIDAAEAAGIAGGRHSLLVLGFESADHPIEAWMARALECARDHGGTYDEEALARPGSNREGAAGQWRNQFMRAPYGRGNTVAAGLVGDTFETAVTWDRFPDFHAEIMARIPKVIEEVTGHGARLTCRFTHVYPDGPAPYFSWGGLGSHRSMIAQWREIKRAAMEAVVSLGGTVTHHHAVGRDHRPGYERQMPPLFLSALQGAKARLDPSGIMNPGVLIDPANRKVGQQGVMAG